MRCEEVFSWQLAVVQLGGLRYEVGGGRYLYLRAIVLLY